MFGSKRNWGRRIVPFDEVLSAGIQGILLTGMLVMIGCQGPDIPLSLDSWDSSQDQQFISQQYHRQAILMKQKAEEFRLQAKRYAELFGPESDWVTSAILLANFYEEEAQDRARLARLHAERAKVTKQREK